MNIDFVNEKMSTKTCLENEARGNSEMAFWSPKTVKSFGAKRP